MPCPRNRKETVSSMTQEKTLIQKRQDLLDEYFVARARKETIATGECAWCEKFTALKFTCCLNCGYIIEVLE